MDLQEQRHRLQRRGLESSQEDRYAHDFSMNARMSSQQKMLCTAEGNPDEEKIGAFGVGEYFDCCVHHVTK